LSFCYSSKCRKEYRKYSFKANIRIIVAGNGVEDAFHDPGSIDPETGREHEQIHLVGRRVTIPLVRF
jgi:hypothetical protein